MVDFVKISGKEHPVSVCWGAICEFCELVGIDKLTDMYKLAEASPLQISQFLWICLWYGAKAEGLDAPEISPDELLLQCDQKTITDFFMLVQKRIAHPASEGDENNDDVKKKK